MIDYKELPKYKKSNIGFFMGCAISIKDITDEQWKVIKLHDMWSLNDWHYHPVVPDFYHIELKSSRDDWNQIFEKVHKAKIEEYKEVKFIINRDHCEHILSRLGNMEYIFGYPREVKDGIKSNKSFSLRSASATLVLDLMCKMGYEKIIIFGIDKHTSAYFWTNTNEYGETHCNTNKNQDINQPHSTVESIKHFIPQIPKKYKIPFYMGYKGSLFDGILPYIDILEEL